MRLGCILGIFWVISCCLSSAVAGSTGPDDRQITDPKSVTSAPNPLARPAPIDDLFYTRSVFGAAWSPDGEQIVFTADISGRFNLWKVRAASGSFISRTKQGTNSTTSTRFRAMAANP